MLILASKSPRRRELMSLITNNFAVDDAHFDESKISADSPLQLALALATGKAATAATNHPRDIIIGCDTVVELNGTTLGKPHSRAEAVEMLSALSGNVHFVHTSVCIHAPSNSPFTFSETTEVHFAAIPSAEIEMYADTEEPYDKAGGYGIQGWAARFIPRINGCYYNVMGLPVPALYSHLRQTGNL